MGNGNWPPFDVLAWRIRMGISQARAAELIDCTTRSFCRWESLHDDLRVRPDPYSVRQMQRLERRKEDGLPLADPVATPMKRRRRVHRPGRPRIGTPAAFW